MQLNYGTEALEIFDDSNEYFQWLYKQIDIYINDRIIEVGAGKGHLEDRRPAASIDPYEAFNYLYDTIIKINEELLITT